MISISFFFIRVLSFSPLSLFDLDREECFERCGEVRAKNHRSGGEIELSRLIEEELEEICDFHCVYRVYYIYVSFLSKFFLRYSRDKDRFLIEVNFIFLFF